MIKLKRNFKIQALIVTCLIIFTFIATNNLVINLYRTGLGISFDWITETSGFEIAEKTLPFRPSDSYGWAILVGWTNSLKVILFGLLLSSLLGVIAGISRSSKNILIRLISSSYVALIRQIPLLIQLLFWYFIVFLNLPQNTKIIISNILTISNKNIYILGLNLSSEFSALLIGLIIFTGASIAEVVRGGINSVEKGQWEAFRSLGINDGKGMQKIIFPQALPAIIPGLTSQYLNLAKNSTLAIAIGYSDIYAVSDTTITQTGRAIEGFVLLLLSFLCLNLIINLAMNIVSKLINKNPELI